MLPRTWLICCLLAGVMAALAPQAAAQRRQPQAQGSEPFDLAPEGIQIRWPALVATMDHARKGEADAAIADARRAIAAAKAGTPEATELALAHGMILLRTGRTAQARQVLQPLADDSDAAVAARAALMLRAGGATPQPAAGPRSLVTAETWAAALLAAAEACTAEIDRTGQSMLKSVDTGDYKEVSAQAASIRARLAEVRAARIHEVADLRCDAERKALKALADAVRRTNEKRAHLDAESAKLYDLVRAGRRSSNSRTQPISAPAPPADVARYNTLRDQLRSATAACQFLVSTYQETRRESTCTIPLESDVKVAKGQSRLPEHLSP